MKQAFREKNSENIYTFFLDIAGLSKLLWDNLYYQFPPNVKYEVPPNRIKINVNCDKTMWLYYVKL